MSSIWKGWVSLSAPIDPEEVERAAKLISDLAKEHPALCETLVPGFVLARVMSQDEKSAKIKATSVVARLQKIQEHAAKTLKVIAEIKAEQPEISTRDLAKELNARGSTTFSRLAWNFPRMVVFLKNHHE